MQRRLGQLAIEGLRLSACGLFAVWCLWNALWLVERQIPPALFCALTGLPCPTTGGTRSIACLLRGEWAESLRANALAIPIALLLALTLACLAGRLLAGRPLRLGGRFLTAWGAVLAVAWIAKLLGDRQYW
ncbi:MAG TPA: DUF2752 domain-containing protein [Pirellulales bacterium]|nr:DUF2752 domain-containing protein [Pirellulales bacterium]